MPASLGAGDELLAFIVDNIPHVVLLALVLFLAAVMIKDLVRGLRRPFLDPTAWKPLQLVDKKTLTHNTRRFRFVLPHEDQQLGLPVGQHITIKASLPDGTEVMRPYTPTSEGFARGHVDFVIKVYPEGRMTQAMDALAIGDRLLFKGPKGRFQYIPGSKKAYGMLAGGTGITPMFQVAQAVLKDPNDSTTLALIFANVTEDDILLRGELEELAKRHPGRFSVYYVLNEANAAWKGGKGFITAEMIKEHLPAPGDDVAVLRCGPPPMMKAMEAHLNALGYAADQQFGF
jgi:cytochrome-b5 reductase